MVKLNLHFTVDEMLRFFRENGMEVEERRVERWSHDEMWHAWEWQVKNPHTGGWENCEKVFKMVMEHRANEFYLTNCNKLDIINILKPKEYGGGN